MEAMARLYVESNISESLSPASTCANPSRQPAAAAHCRPSSDQRRWEPWGVRLSRSPRWEARAPNSRWKATSLLPRSARGSVGDQLIHQALLVELDLCGLVGHHGIGGELPRAHFAAGA